jgi:hypothetical protein
MAVRVLFVDGTDTVYYGAHSASRQGQHVVVTKNRDNGPPALVAALKAERVAGVEILERGVGLSLPLLKFSGGSVDILRDVLH